MSMTDAPRTYKPVAKRATLYTDLTLTHATHGVALRMGDGHVYFQADSSGQWTELYDADLPRIHLHGQEDLVLCQKIQDGNLVLHASRTLQRSVVA